MSLRCGSCGASYSLVDYFNRKASASSSEELEERLARVPVNRL